MSNNHGLKIGDYVRVLSIPRLFLYKHDIISGRLLQYRIAATDEIYKVFSTNGINLCFITIEAHDGYRAILQNEYVERISPLMLLSRIDL